MTSKTLRSALVAGVALAGLMISAPAFANAVGGFDPTDFGVIEGPGQYTVFDHSTDWYITGFSVTNPQFDFTSTNRPGWTSYSFCGSGDGAFCENVYYNQNDVTFDIQPGETDGRFHFTAAEASHYQIDLINGDGVTNTVGGDALHNGVPEPASWALMIAGFGLTGAVLRRRRAGVVAQTA